MRVAEIESHKTDVRQRPTLVVAEPLDGVENGSAISKRYMEYFGRFTGALGLIFLVLGLGVWMFRQGDHRLALLILVCAMFLSILHYYSLEDGQDTS